MMVTLLNTFDALFQVDFPILTRMTTTASSKSRTYSFSIARSSFSTYRVLIYRDADNRFHDSPPFDGMCIDHICVNGLVIKAFYVRFKQATLPLITVGTSQGKMRFTSFF